VAIPQDGAYRAAFRRFVRIRQIASDGAGEEATILARSLLSIVARAAWVDRPDDPEERRSRFERYAKRQLTDRINSMEGLRAIGVADIDDDVIEEERQQLARFAHAKSFPTDRQLLEDLGLEVPYHRVYKLSSDHVHFSLSVAIDGLRDVDEVPLEQDSPELADEALCLAILSLGLFLGFSEKTVKHGLEKPALELIGSSPAFTGPDK
jgi:Family of unknown function (DUF5677)